jgi:hypothetical protein
MNNPNPKDVEKIVERMVMKVLPVIFKEKLNNFRIGTIVEIKSPSLVDVKLSGTGDIIKSVNIQMGADNLAIGNQCMVVSTDPLLKGQVKAIVFGEGKADTNSIKNDAITDSKLIHGKIRTRQGGSETDWTTPGTETYDYSATDTWDQIGVIAVTSATQAVTFPIPYNINPVVSVSVITANSKNVWARATTVTTTGFVVACLSSTTSSEITEVIMWRSTGE